MPERFVRRRRAPDHRAPQSQLGDPLEFARAVGDIFERDQRDAHQTVGIIRAKLRQPVVVGFEARGLQSGVFDSEQRHAQGGVQHFGANPVDFLVLDSLHRVPMALGMIALGLFHEIDQILAAAAGGESAGDRKRSDPRRDKHMAGLPFHLDHPRSAVLEPDVEPIGPQIWRLHHMGIR